MIENSQMYNSEVAAEVEVRYERELNACAQILEVLEQATAGAFQSRRLSAEPGTRQRERASLMFLAKGEKSFLAIINLFRLGFDQESHMLSRTLMEMAMVMAWIAENPEERLLIWGETEGESRNRIIRQGISAFSEDVLDGVERERIEESQAAYDRYQDRDRQDRFPRFARLLQQLGIPDDARNAIELSYTLSSQLIHSTPVGVSQYIVREDEAGIHYDSGPRVPKNPATLSNAIIALRAVTESFGTLIRTDIRDALAETEQLMREVFLTGRDECKVDRSRPLKEGESGNHRVARHESLKGDESRPPCYFVAFFDILGQRAKLRSLRALPTNPEEAAAAGRVLKETVGAVLKLRKLFEGYFNAMAQATVVRDRVPEDKLQMFDEMRASEASYRGFSDSIIITVPLEDTNEFCTPTRGIFSALTACCGIFVASLALGHVPRGGMDIGLGVAIDKDEVYGPALERAYTLESTVADYPRLVVGEELLRYLRAVESQNAQTPFGVVAGQVAGLCLELIVEDSDGVPILDYLGPAFKRQIGDEVIPAEVVEKAFHFAKTEQERFLDLGCEKLATRYERLVQFIDLRISIWRE